MMHKKWLQLLSTALATVLFSSCLSPSASPPPDPVMINGKIIREMSDRMMRSLLNSPVMDHSSAVPRIALLRFRNRSRFPIDGELFLGKLRADLNSRATGRIIFLDRTDIMAVKAERQAKRDGIFTFTQGSLQKAISGADYFITGELRSLSGAGTARQGKYTSGNRRSDYLLFVFYLVNAENSDILWEDQFEIDFEADMNRTYI